MPCAGRLAAVHPEIALAAECGRRGPRIDRDPLSSPAAEPPQLGGRQPRRRDARRRGRRDLEVARENRIAARQPRRVEGGRILAGPAPELSKDTAGVTPVTQWAELSRRPWSGQGSSRPFKPGYTAPHRRRCVLHVLVTGAASGIGRATCLRVARDARARGQAAKIAAVDLGPPPELDRLVEELRKLDAEALALHGDMGSVDAPARVVGEAVGRFGGLDGLVSNAGINRPAPPLHYPVGDRVRLFAGNTRATQLPGQ